MSSLPFPALPLVCRVVEPRAVAGWIAPGREDQEKTSLGLAKVVEGGQTTTAGPSRMITSDMGTLSVRVRHRNWCMAGEKNSALLKWRVSRSPSARSFPSGVLATTLQLASYLF